jgi:hypothetical protein
MLLWIQQTSHAQGREISLSNLFDSSLHLQSEIGLHRLEIPLAATSTSPPP